MDQIINPDFNYDEEIYNKKSAEIVLPILHSFFPYQSVLDIGCGLGTWLAVARELGSEKIQGVDGDYADKSILYSNISSNNFSPADLNKGFNLVDKFDLTICLEVVEHLSPESAPVIVESIARHSDVILFSAAIPGQGGQNHLNEQWPEYWANLFALHDYVFLDIIRPLIWGNPKVDFWYKQNVFVVVKESHILARQHTSSFVSLVHPELFTFKMENSDTRIRILQKQLNVNPLKRWVKSLIS